MGCPMGAGYPLPLHHLGHWSSPWVRYLSLLSPFSALLPLACLFHLPSLGRGLPARASFSLLLSPARCQ